MLSKNQLFEILLDWNYWNREFPKTTPRKSYEDKIAKLSQTDEVVVVKGVRRCGKSTLFVNERGTPSSVVKIKKDNKEIIEAGIGEGTIDAIFKTIDKMTQQEGKLLDYKVQSVSKGKDALASVTVKVSFNGEATIIGHGLNIDTMLASARAYVGALNSYLSIVRK